MIDKNEAFAYLQSLRDTLTTTLPDRATLLGEMVDLAQDGASDHRIRENRFIYHFIIRRLHDHMQSVPGIGASEAKRALLCEYHAKVSDISSGNPLRRSGAPLGKSRNKSTEAIIRDWTKTATSFPINQAYPDLAIRSPFPHAIVFDVKYFDSNSTSKAEEDLINGVYEAIHYRSLPHVAPKSATDPGWGYDYGCLLAYDASDKGVLASAWRAVLAKEAFWEGANVYVLIIRD